MPKPKNKRNIRKRRLPPDNTEINSVTDCHIPKKQRRVNEINPEDSIAKSEQLTLKLQNSKKKQRRVNKINPEDSIAKSKQLTLKLQNSKKKCTQNTKLRVCGNGKPMPPLAELNCIFADSGDENETIDNSSDKCVTPEQQLTHVTAEKIISPKTIVDISVKLENILSNPMELTKLIEVTPPPPIVPQTRSKKTGIPYIVGCKDRPQIKTKPVVTFCKGSSDYGVNKTRSEEEYEHEPLKKHKRCTQKINLSKSIFNAHSDEVALMLKDTENDKSLGDVNVDSNKTEIFAYNNSASPSPKNKQRSFSPLPSTSTDFETFHKNDKLFNESLVLLDDSTHSVDCEIIDTHEAVAINNVTENNIKETNVEKNEQNSSKSISNDTNDDYYSSIDITQRYNNDIIECVDVDEIINESVAIVKKYRKKNGLNTATLVKSSASNVNIEITDPHCNTIVQPGTSGVNTEIVDPDSNKFVQPDTSEVDTETIVPHSNTVVQLDNLEVRIEIADNDCLVPVQLGSSKSNTNSEDTDCIIINDDDRNSNTSNRVIGMCSTSTVRKKLNKTNYINPSKQLLNNQNIIQNLVSKFFSTSRINPHLNRIEPIDVISNDIQQQGHSWFTSNYFFDTVRKWTTSLSSAYFNSKNNQRNVKKPRSRVNISKKMSNHPHSRNSSYARVEIQKRGNESTQNVGRQNFQNHYHNRNAQSSNIPHIADLSTTLNTNQQLQKPNQILTETVNEMQNLPPNPTKNIGECPICMDSLCNNTIASTTCGHVFCMNCIKASIKTGGKKCPTCRKILKGVGYHQLFL